MDKIIYFDNAATTYPKPDEVYFDMDRTYRTMGVNVGRGQYKLASKAANLMQETRDLVLSLFHATNKSVIFTHTATEALNLLLNNFVKDDCNVYVSPFEHNAVTRVLEKIKSVKRINVCVLPFNLKQWEYDYKAITQAFSKNAPNVLIISHASNVCGYVSPIFELCTMTKSFGCVNIIDMCQTAGLIETDLSTDNIDYAVFDGHKTMYGSFGIAGIIGNNFSTFSPLVYGGTGIDSANQDMPKQIPERLEAGSHNIQAISGLNSALKWLLNKGVVGIFEVENANHTKLLSVLKKHLNVKIVSPINTEISIGVVSCVFDGYGSDNIGNILSQHDIAVRTGLHCAPLAHKTLGTYPTGTVRLSVGFFNNDEDFEALDKVLDYIEEGL